MKSKLIKRQALENLRGNWIVAIIGCIIASLLGVTTGFSINVSFSYNYSYQIVPDQSDVQQAAAYNESFAEAMILFFVIYFIILALVWLALFIIGSAVGVGYAEFNLDLTDGLRPRLRDLFGHFGQLKTAMLARILVFLRVLGGLCLFIVPGIVAAYKYSMVNYVIAENPGISASDALYESKRIMKGNKWSLFCLGLSFIGWTLLVWITGGIASIWVAPYEQAAIAEFYRRAKRGATY